MVIEVCKRDNDPGMYHTQVKDIPQIWAAGNSIDEAIGNLIRYHPDYFRIDVTVLHGVSR